MLDEAPDPVRKTFETVADSAPEIRAGLPGRRTKTGEENVSGEEVMAADLWADELLGERLGSIEGVGQYASEEREAVADTGGDPAAEDIYAVAVDPLDGSSNLRSNNPMGTVVGIYDAALPAPDREVPAVGRELVAAGFVLYGPITTMVLARGDDCREYVVEKREGPSASAGAGEDTGEPRAGELRDVGPVELPDDPVVYGFGGRVPDWPDDVAGYVDEVEDELKLRYGGAMIADVSQVLTYGGIFAYPGLESRPEGKLRLLFEGAPMGYVVAAAGGSSSDGERSLLDVEATDLHQRVPVHVGNDDLVERLEDALA
jgi:fructose-1,6-bisphosphatase I